MSSQVIFSNGYMNMSLYILFLWFLLQPWACQAGAVRKRILSRKLDVKSMDTVPGLVQFWGYDLEEHRVTTEDGYILTMFRIPRSREETVMNNNQPGKMPVFLGHALFTTSAMYSFGPPDRSLAYILADRGYDVWMGNSRGTPYSTDHVTLDSCTSCKEFWDFTFDEMGHYDMAANIDYILQHTGQDQLFYIGTSLGTSQYLALLALRPEYNEKIKAGFLIAPVAFLRHTTSNYASSIGNVTAELVQDLHERGLYTFTPMDVGEYELLSEFCSMQFSLVVFMCGFLAEKSAGFSSGQLMQEMVPVYMKHFPATTSANIVEHYGQIYRSGYFERYDYGLADNVRRYGQERPPLYNVSLITAPTALIVGDGDKEADSADADILAGKLPNLIENYRVARKGWSHADNVMGKDLNKLVFEPIMGFMEQFE